MRCVGGVGDFDAGNVQHCKGPLTRHVVWNVPVWSSRQSLDIAAASCPRDSNSPEYIRWAVFLAEGC